MKKLILLFAVFLLLIPTLGWGQIIPPSPLGSTLFLTQKSTPYNCYNPKTYGAVMDGVTDDFAALKATIDTATSHRGNVCIPAGTLYADFRGKATIALKSGVILNGAGKNKTFIRTNTAPPSADQTLFTISTNDTAYIQNLSVVGPDSSTSYMTLAFYHVGSGLVKFNKVYIEGFSGAIDFQNGTVNLSVTNSEIAKCGWGILYSGSNGIQPTFTISNCIIRDTRAQTSLAGYPNTYNFHCIYVGRQTNLYISNCQLLRSTGSGLQFWAGDLSLTSSHIISGCSFDGSYGGLILGNATGATDTVTNCYFGTSTSAPVLRMQEGNAYIDGSSFAPMAGTMPSAIGVQGTTPGNLYISNSTFTLPTPSANYSALGIGLLGTSSCTWTVYNCTFTGAGGNRGSAIRNTSNTGTILARQCTFGGTYSTAYQQGAILVEGGSVTVDSSLFNIVGDAALVLPDAGLNIATIALTNNTITTCTDFLRVETGNAGATVNTSGNNNLISSGTEVLDDATGITSRNYLLGNRTAPDGTVASSGTITLSRNFNYWHISGTNEIDSIKMAGTYNATEYGQCAINLIADAAYNVGSTGNITPDKITARTIGDTVKLVYYTSLNKWMDTTTVRAPIATTNDATSITDTSCIFHGSIMADGASTVSRFIWGTVSGTYTDSATAAESPVTGWTTTSISYTKASGLAATTKYYFCAVGSNISGYVRGSQDSLTTTAHILPDIAFDATSGDQTVGRQLTRTWYHTVTGTNTYLVVAVGSTNSNKVDSVKCAGAKMTFIDSCGAVGDNAARIEFWGLKSPRGGLDTIVSYVASPGGYSPTISASYTNVNQTTPVGAVAKIVISSGASDSLIVSSGTGQVVVTGHARETTSAEFTATGTGEAKRNEKNLASGRDVVLCDLPSAGATTKEKGTWVTTATVLRVMGFALQHL